MILISGYYYHFSLERIAHCYILFCCGHEWHFVTCCVTPCFLSASALPFFFPPLFCSPFLSQLSSLSSSNINCSLLLETALLLNSWHLSLSLVRSLYRSTRDSMLRVSPGTSSIASLSLVRNLVSRIMLSSDSGFLYCLLRSETRRVPQGEPS